MIALVKPTIGWSASAALLLSFATQQGSEATGYRVRARYQGRGRGLVPVGLMFILFAEPMPQASIRVALLRMLGAPFAAGAAMAGSAPGCLPAVPEALLGGHALAAFFGFESLVFPDDFRAFLGLVRRRESGGVSARAARRPRTLGYGHTTPGAREPAHRRAPMWSPAVVRHSCVS